VRGFSDYKETEKKDDDTVNWFTGGEKSGLQVQAPGNKKELIDGFLKGAQNSGAQDFSDYEQSQNTFSGSGYRLGQTSSQPVPSNKKPIIRKKIILWKNGFTVGDGPLRDYYDPSNQAFMKQIQKGEMPSEFSKEAAQGEIDVDLSDKSGEDYKEPLKVVQAFSGTGQKLGSTSSAPTSVTTVNTSTPTPKPVNIDPSQPTTSIQIRLSDGQRMVGTFNHNHTILDIKQYITSSTNCSFVFDLMTAFPQALLSNESQTIKEAGLINSVIIQKRK